jgi:hypothetical protein
MDVTGLKCADLVDAMGRLHRHRCHIPDLVSPRRLHNVFSIENQTTTRIDDYFEREALAAARIASA